MNYLLAKERGVRGNFLRVLSDVETFSYPDNLVNVVEFDNDYKLEPDEWFYVEDFNNKEFCIEFLKRDFISAEYPQISERAQYKKLEFLCSIQDGYYYFQKLGASQYIKKKYISLAPSAITIEESPIIIVNHYPDAIYDKTNNSLYFKNLFAIASIFKGIETLYREATQQQTEEFLSNDFIKLEEGYSADSVKKTNRKRIAMVMETISTYTAVQKAEMRQYINGYCDQKLNYDEDTDTYSISNEEELKLLLYGIEERFYTTPRSGEKRLANSVIKM